MSKKKKKTAVSSGESQKPEEAKPSGQNSENYITIEIPDKPGQPQSAQPEIKPDKKPDKKPEKKPEPKPEERHEKKHEAKPEKKLKEKPEKKTKVKPEKKPEPPAPQPAPQKAPTSDESENPQNEISIELPDSEAEKLKTFTPQVTSPEKKPLTPEQIAARKHHRRVILSKTANVVFLVILVLMGLLILFPIFFTIIQSLKSTAELGDVPNSFFPKDFTFKSFVSLL